MTTGNPTVLHKTTLIIRTDGSTETIPGVSLAAIQKAIAAEGLDFVRIGRRDGTDLVMAVDDFGYETKMIDHGNGRIEMQPVTPRKPINERATELYHAICKPGTTHKIVGDVAILHDEDKP